LISGDRLHRLLDEHLKGKTFESLPVRFIAIATEYGTGHEIWLSKGDLIEAMRASYALPGVFTPVLVGDRWLMDGALVNPIPITAARAIGADVVVCVGLNTDVKSRAVTIQAYVPHEKAVNAAATLVHEGPLRGAFSLWKGLVGRSDGAPAWRL
jgi:NTE family protein